MSDARQDPGLGPRDSGNTTPVDLDAAIDAVAREMTESEPPGALRARVLERIEQGRRRSSPAVPRWAWAGAAAAVVLAVATAVWVARPIPAPGDALVTVAEQRVGTPSPGAAATARQATPPAAAPESVATTSQFATASPAGPSAAAARMSRAAAVRGAWAAEVEGAEDFHTVPALAEIEPLRLSAVEPDPLQIAAVNVAALPAMPSIDIPGLDPGSPDIQSADPKKEK